MKKIQKSKKGFTLVEMVLVIAIIVILAAVLIIGITKYLNGANAAKHQAQDVVGSGHIQVQTVGQAQADDRQRAIGNDGAEQFVRTDEDPDTVIKFCDHANPFTGISYRISKTLRSRS